MAQQLSPDFYAHPPVMALQYPPEHPNFGQSAQPSQAELAAYAVEYPPVPDRRFIWKALMGLDDTWTRTLLLRISDTQARVAWEIWDECKRRRRDPQLARAMISRKKERLASRRQNPGTNASEVQTWRESPLSDASTANPTQTPLTFDEESRAIWFMLKREHASMSDASQIEAASVVYKDIIWVINHVHEQTASTTTSFESRRNALGTLRNIGESVLNAPGALGDEVRKRFRGGTELKDSMVGILRQLKHAERDKVANMNDCQSTFHEKVASLAGRDTNQDIFGEMKGVAEFLKGEITMRELGKIRSSSYFDEAEIKDEDHLDVSLLNSALGKSPDKDVMRGIKRKRLEPRDSSESSRTMTIDVHSANQERVSSHAKRQDSALGHSGQHQACFSAIASSEEPSNRGSTQMSVAGRSSLHLPEVADRDSSSSSTMQEPFEQQLQRAPSRTNQSAHLVRTYAVTEHFDITD